ncbi:hypothetical protein HPB48_014472 [Haemaphysalis longicornis]|uniref:YqaJ viral recombinase domain-containing protein n=1 Tax=Haemaphysalis longicornis TaxID=44386 RepID=A0A9J6FWM5_HAELO|nr:hypothetical protein HPB48_014472 [Haemaphysalis longicornis]
MDPRLYGITMEPVAIAKYTELRALADRPVTVLRTGLHVHKDYPFLAGSPDGIVQEATGEEGLLEVKCPSTQNGLKRLGELHATGVGPIPFRLFEQGFHTCELKSDGLKMAIRKAT